LKKHCDYSNKNSIPIYALKSKQKELFDPNDVTLDSNHNYFILTDDESCSSKIFSQIGTNSSEVLFRHKLEVELKKVKNSLALSSGNQIK
jgi:hypothetical protein